MAGNHHESHYRILMVSTEAAPFAKAGGMADAVAALSAQLSRSGHDVRIVMPRYYGIRRDTLYRLPSPFRVFVGDTHVDTAVYEGRLPNSEVVVYFIDYEELYGRDGIYGTPAQAFADNLRRFTLLSHAAVQIGERIGWTPEILHAHDWPASLVPVLSRTTERAHRGYATVLTIHNLGYQGTFPVSSFPQTGLRWSQLQETGLLHNDEINMLRAGILHADMVTTVSPRYAKEIRTPRFGFSLDPILSARADRLVGILNGVDYTLWNPERDPNLEANYTVETIALKDRVKTGLQAELGLTVSAETPLIGMVTRLVSHKGLEELVTPGYGALAEILSELPVQVAVLGSGDPAYEYELRTLAARFPNLVAVIGFDDRLAHRIEAGADFFLMPSRYEPCGLNQMYSLRYGTIPIVTCTGGLADSVHDIDEAGGTGLVMERPCPEELASALRRAVSIWQEDRGRIDAARRTAMRERFTWEAAAGGYEQAYETAIRNRRDGGAG